MIKLGGSIILGTTDVNRMNEFACRRDGGTPGADLLQIRPKDLDNCLQVLLSPMRIPSRNHMLAQMPFYNLGHEPIDRSTHSGDLLQNCRALGFLVQRLLEGLHLPFDTADPRQQWLLISDCMGHRVG